MEMRHTNASQFIGRAATGEIGLVSLLGTHLACTAGESEIAEVITKVRQQGMKVLINFVQSDIPYFVYQADERRLEFVIAGRRIPVTQGLLFIQGD